ncbi:MAG: FtsW/RodA/SpoVE family cell cycle protein [Chitinophagales bacterium]
MNRVLEHIKGDRVIWGIAFLLSFFSMLAVYSSTGTLAYKYQAGNTEYYLIKHSSILFLGLSLMYVAHKIHYRYYSRISLFLLILSVPLLLITLLIGTNLNEAQRWITLPIINLSFQTSDLAKMALIMFLARTLSKRQDMIKDFGNGFVPLVIPVFIVCALIAPADLSTAVILFITSLILMFMGRVAIKHLALLIGSVVLVAALAVSLLFSLPAEVLAKTGRAATWKSRLVSFSDKEAAVPYQVQQAKIAIAKGGIFGEGPGKSGQRNFLPHPYSDFIYAIVLEEYGFIGGMIVLCLYIILLFRTIQIVINSPGAFGALLALGLMFNLVIQALTNMAVAVNLLPVTGLTLPFISMGGTSLFFTSISLGVVLSVSRNIELTNNKNVGK